MQQKDCKSKELATVLGEVIKQIRLKDKKSSINKFAHEYDLDVGNTSRIENGQTDIKLVTLWKIAEALNIKTSKLISIVENKLGKDFYFYEK